MNEVHNKPPRPNLDVKNSTNGSMCLDAEDTTKLLNYINQLEKGFK